uniref:Uncharacterized protein n=1 Tax=Anguilla anguilla TaxID=7936 RepID=A0A0E9S6W0_ANGAN
MQNMVSMHDTCKEQGCENLIYKQRTLPNAQRAFLWCARPLCLSLRI